MAIASEWDHEALRQKINSYPPYAGACIEVTYIAADASEVRVRMPLVANNVNLVGTHFGGSLYAMVDPHLMVLLKQRLGPEYVVWDRAASIDFLRPGKSTVYATVLITDEEVEAIRSATRSGGKHLPEWHLEIVDEQGAVVATVRKTLYVRHMREEPPP